jgi:hypothetical protein
MQEEFSRAGLGSCGDFNRAFDMLLTLNLAKIEALIPKFRLRSPLLPRWMSWLFLPSSVDFDPPQRLDIGVRPTLQVLRIGLRGAEKCVQLMTWSIAAAVFDPIPSTSDNSEGDAVKQARTVLNRSSNFLARSAPTPGRLCKMRSCRTFFRFALAWR